jgi:hypothetical protein
MSMLDALIGSFVVVALALCISKFTPPPQLDRLTCQHGSHLNWSNG